MKFAILIVVSLLASTLMASAATYLVRPDGTGDVPTIQAALDASVSGDTVLLAYGTYHEHDLAMKSGVCLRSESGEMAGAVIDALGLGRVLRCDNVDRSTRIEGLTFTGGTVEDNFGGGIYCSNSSPLISRCLCFPQGIRVDSAWRSTTRRDV